MLSLLLTLNPRIISHKEDCKRDVMKCQQKENYNRHHRVQPLQELNPGDPVLIKTDREKGWKLPGNVHYVRSWSRHHEVSSDGIGDTWNGLIQLHAIKTTSVARHWEQSSLQTRWWGGSFTMHLQTDSPMCGLSRHLRTWLGSLGHQWQAHHHHRHRHQGSETLHLHWSNLHTDLHQCQQSLQCLLHLHLFTPDMAASSTCLPEISDHLVCCVVPWAHKCVVLCCAMRAHVATV